MPPEEDDDFGPMGHPQRMASADDERLPERAARGNDARPERVPTKGHEGSVPVDERTWERNERLRGTAEGLLDEEPPQE